MRNASDTSALSKPTQSFHQLLPDNYRGTLLDAFHRAARAGHDTPTAVVAAVIHEIGNRLGRLDLNTTHADALNALLAAMGQEPDGAKGYAAVVIDWNGLSKHERQKRKAAQAQVFQAARMTELPPTEKQLAFLQSLGDDGTPPESRAEASQRIEALKNRRDQTPFGHAVREKAHIAGNGGVR